MSVTLLFLSILGIISLCWFADAMHKILDKEEEEIKRKNKE